MGIVIFITFLMLGVFINGAMLWAALIVGAALVLEFILDISFDEFYDEGVDDL